MALYVDDLLTRTILKACDKILTKHAKVLIFSTGLSLFYSATALVGCSSDKGWLASDK